MPKIILTNTETGENEQFEPVDAREILRMEGTVYEPSQEHKEQIGVEFTSPGVAAVQKEPVEGEVNYWQLQGADNELETGLSVQKYRRDQVVLAVPSSPEFEVRRPLTATARPGETFVRREDAEAADDARAEAEEGVEVEKTAEQKAEAKSAREQRKADRKAARDAAKAGRKARK